MSVPHVKCVLAEQETPNAQLLGFSPIGLALSSILWGLPIPKHIPPMLRKHPDQVHPCSSYSTRAPFNELAPSGRSVEAWSE